jgi:hypothetical protein
VTGQIGTIDPSTGAVTLRPQVPGFVRIAFGGDEATLYAADGQNEVFTVDSATGAAGGYVSCGGATGNGLAIGGDGLAWLGVLDQVTQFALASCVPSGSALGGVPSGSGHVGPHLRALSYSSGLMFAVDIGNDQLVTFDGDTFPGGGTPSLTTIGNLAADIDSVAVYQTVSFVPEPSAVVLLGIGVAGLVGIRYHCRRSR